MLPKLTLEERFELIEKVRSRELTVISVCKLFGISRTVFYRLNRRYSETGDKSALKPKKAVILNHPRKASPEKEQKVLDIVSRHPEYSSRTLARFVTVNYFAISEKGARNIIQRSNLNTYKKRLAWVRGRN